MCESTRDHRTERGAEDSLLDLDVLALLHRYDGWAWRANIKVAFGWTTAETDAVLARLELRGWVNRHDGRGAEVVSLPGCAPDLLVDRD